jgi:outer membrane lipoprotein-sorting protein
MHDHVGGGARRLRGRATALLALVPLLRIEASGAATPAQQALARFGAAWAGVRAYRCRITEHQVLGDETQDRVYQMAFQKPHDTRLRIVEGPGRGGVLVWRGGPQARGHRGGWLRFITRAVGIHDPRATSLRGTTVAQADFGSVLDHVGGLDTSSLAAETRHGNVVVDAVVADPALDGGVTREMLVLGSSGLPVEYRQLQGNQVVRDVSYGDVEVNARIPPSDFEL